ncbi:DotU family type IV/VI secretion system protein [Paraburkholderia sp. J63]|uniref:DotU family type IV/VI secretion system protein n=1 Tax=Paraburkholderia sp. J63 TaxID=2805434 RepID=UPI002ABDA22A|nr:DotU family type IV/VI secretion system protein [Paraburkholderia sp. J63]
MTSLTSRRNGLALMDRAPGAEPVIGSGMRDELRDTALLVTSLAPGGRVKDAVQLRGRCTQVMGRFSDAITRRGYPEGERQDAMLAQCGLLDEIALRHLNGESRATWELTPLQVERFGLHDAGVSVIDRMEARVREASPNADLLECYAAILGMGFMGRYALDGETKRNALMSALASRLEKIRPAADQPFMADHSARRLSDWFYRLAPWVVAGLACVVAAIVWGLWGVALDAQLAHIVPARVVHP